jgi:hypothetical protein
MARCLKLEASNVIYQDGFRRAAAQPMNRMIDLQGLRLTAGQRVVGAEQIKGELKYSVRSTVDGTLAVRVQYEKPRSSVSSLIYHREPLEQSGRVPFSIPPINDLRPERASEVYNGLMVLFFDLVSCSGPKLEEKLTVSNTIACLVQVV